MASVYKVGLKKVLFCILVSSLSFNFCSAKQNQSCWRDIFVKKGFWAGITTVLSVATVTSALKNKKSGWAPIALGVGGIFALISFDLLFGIDKDSDECDGVCGTDFCSCGREECSGFCSANSPYGQCSCSDCAAWPDSDYALDAHFHHNSCICIGCLNEKEKEEKEPCNFSNCSCVHVSSEESNSQIATTEIYVTEDRFNQSLELVWEAPFDA